MPCTNEHIITQYPMSDLAPLAQYGNTAAYFAKNDFKLTVDAATKLITAYPKAGHKGRPVSDPMGGELDTYRTTADELEAEIRRVFDHFAAEQVPGAS